MLLKNIAITPATARNALPNHRSSQGKSLQGPKLGKSTMASRGNRTVRYSGAGLFSASLAIDKEASYDLMRKREKLEALLVQEAPSKKDGSILYDLNTKEQIKLKQLDIAVLAHKDKPRIEADFKQYTSYLHPEYSPEQVDKLSDKFMSLYFEPDSIIETSIKVEEFSNSKQLDNFMDLVFESNSKMYEKQRIYDLIDSNMKKGDHQKNQALFHFVCDKAGFSNTDHAIYACIVAL